MKHTIKFYAMLACLAGLAVFYSCSDDDDSPSTFTIASAMAGSKDLNGATAATEVPLDADLVVTFNTDVDESTATSSNITLKRIFDDVAVPLSFDVSGKTLTIAPSSELSGGVQYLLSVGAGLKSASGVAFGAVERTFTTTGTFAPDGALAHWRFENNGNDEMGDHNADASVEVTYVDGRNANAGKAASFNGTTSIMEVPDGTDFTNTANFSISLWIKPDTTARAGGGNFVLGLGASNGFQIELHSKDAKMAAQYDLGGGMTGGEDTWIDGKGNLGWQGWTFSKNYGAQGLAAVLHGKWVNLVFTYTAATKVGAAYVNGELAKTFDFNKWPDGDAKRNVTGMKFKTQDGVGQKLAFGFINDRSSTAFDYGNYENVDAQHYKGLLDDVRIYNKAITLKEIEVMYNSEKP
ncbi:LamG-like jellyroll fold domain-containing protein [Parachryseolinea silvisoli]|uniref:LamG-like jellyroll fold domain-containing protein n=1 Tax=Parachryseolinea silvisoli TaxID=2873601 RepID=UPI002265EB3E|nr:LamG-like jellyroll fold domain-containing protein [Parachryseolinea silvisoli]MCD9014646.1 Ig-like domain-containing protein [Parachryseolinea silvisoli]